MNTEQFGAGEVQCGSRQRRWRRFGFTTAERITVGLGPVWVTGRRRLKALFGGAIVRSYLLVTISFAAILAAPAIAHAQDDSSLARDVLFARDRNVSVRQRPRPEYAESPRRLGAFLLTPTLTAAVEGNDNILATANNTQSDTIFHVQPSAVLATDWSRNALSLYGRASFNEYADKSTESTADYQVGATGRLDVLRTLGFSAGGSYERDTEPRTSSGSPAGVRNPIRYDLGSVYLQGTKEFNRLRVTGRFDFRDFDYQNGVSTAGTRVYQDDRDHSIVSGAGKVEYAVNPDKSIFINAVFNDRGFRSQLPGENARNSSGYELTVGSNFDITHLIRGEIYLGYLEQDYVAPFGSVSGLSARGQVEYFMTQLTTVTVAGSRSVEDAGIVGASGYLSSNVSAQLDHEFLRNLIVTGNVSYGNDSYQGFARTDDRTTVSVGGTYLLNRATGLNVTYSHYKQDSSGSAAGQTFDVNRILASAVYQF